MNQLVLERRIRFALANGTPRPDSFCVMCEARIEARYLREVATQLIYCDQSCYDNHCRSAARALVACVRAS
jgi:hypothetical protein